MALPERHERTERRARESAHLATRGIGLNAVLAAAKFAGGIFGHTYALIADGTESLLDVLASAFVWVGVRVAGRPPDADHPYGHGKADAIAALAASAVVFAAAGFVGWHAVHEISAVRIRPHWITLPLLVVIIVTKVWYSRHLEGAEAGGDAGSTALGAETLHQWTDVLTSAAAFIGIALALWGGPSFEKADDWAALFACLVIAFSGGVMLKRALSEMMDTAVPADFDREVRALALTVPGVGALDRVRIRKSGLSHLVDIEVRVDGNLTVRQGHDIAHAVTDTLVASPTLAISDVSVHVEPMR
ncbi:MAG TPA: cation diffusion facilitator family transporter [Candidatus Didemnitutus sp.]|nr:cation diffusion facilitator family transporter [Candidatus Didemnitutus sp.]